MRRITLVDTSVHLFHVTWQVEKSLHVVQHKGLKLENYVRACVAARFNKPIDFMAMDSELVYCADLKDEHGHYWRHKIVPHYKGNRKPKTELFLLVKEQFEKYASDYDLKIYRKPLFEADDIIAYWCRKFREDRTTQLYISTVDSDLMTLVKPNVFFAWTYANTKVRLFDESLVKAYVAKKFKRNIERASDISKIKAEKGDSSDNLKKGSPVEVVDLIEAHYSEYGELDFGEAKDIVSHLPNKEHRKKAIAYARKFGLGITV